MSDSFDAADHLITLDRVESGYRAADPTGSTVHVTTRGWTETDPVHEFPERVDRSVSGRTRELRLPSAHAEIRPLDDGVAVAGSETPGFIGGYTVLNGDAIDLPEASFSLRLTGRDLYTFVRFHGPARVESDGVLSISFPRPTAVTLGFRSLVRLPRNRLTVPRSPGGLATALTHLSAAHRTDSPDRSFITLRAHPPLVSFSDDGTDAIPVDVRNHTPETGIEVRAPGSIAALLAVAPLAYYLGADVVAEGRDDVVVRAPAQGVDRVLDEPVDAAAGRLLRRIFGMDCLVRSAGPYGSDFEELDALAEVPFAIDDWYDEPPATRFARYLDPDLDELDGVWPRWQHVVTVEPSYETVRLLPTLLDSLAWLRLPDADEAVTTTPYPAVGTTTAGGGGYETTPAAQDHRFEFLADQRDEWAKHELVVVCNDDRRREAAGRLAAAESSKGSPTVRTDLAVSALREQLADRCGLLHFVGSWDDGFVCRDGVLPVEDSDVGARVCVLDAPGAAAACPRLVDGGAVAAAGRPADAAPGVGETFVRAIAEGFAYAQALELEAIDGGSPYRLVGDGVDSLDPNPSLFSALAVSGSGDSFTIRTHGLYPNPGGMYSTHDDRLRFAGNSDSADESVSELHEAIALAPQPILAREGIHWPEDHDLLLYPFA